ncbi:MAG TPA: hypothetical protein VIM53_02600 [Candidatus Saccharimonadales bacterium]
MLIVLHILSALSSLAVTTVAVVRPSATALRVDALLTAFTMMSGTALVVMSHAHMLSACATGLAYLSFALSGLLVSRYRLAHATVKVRGK